MQKKRLFLKTQIDIERVKYLKRSRPITMKAAYHLLCGKKVTFSGSKAAAKVIVTEVGPFLSSLASALKFVDICRQCIFETSALIERNIIFFTYKDIFS